MPPTIASQLQAGQEKGLAQRSQRHQQRRELQQAILARRDAEVEVEDAGGVAAETRAELKARGDSLQQAAAMLQVVEALLSNEAML